MRSPKPTSTISERCSVPRPSTWQEGDAALENFVLSDQGAHDEELLQLFHRRFLRYKMTLGPAGSAMVTHHPIQRFNA